MAIHTVALPAAGPVAVFTGTALLNPPPVILYRAATPLSVDKL